MSVRKEVFISATSADLGSYRRIAKEALLTLGAHPVEEENFPTDYRELQALLARRLDPCDALVPSGRLLLWRRAKNSAGYSAAILDTMGVLPCDTGHPIQTCVSVHRQ
jgi:hypothetical protein